MSDESVDKNFENIRTLYSQLCTSYHAIDDFRAKLLGFLPTGTGIFLLAPQLLDKDGGPFRSNSLQIFSPPIGAFGFVIALGLFFYELYGTRKCTHLIGVGKYLESKLGMVGQFDKRAPSIGGLISEPFAAGIIYPAVLGAWAFLAFSASPQDARYWAILVFGFFVAVSCLFMWWLRMDGNRLATQLRIASIQLSES